MTICFLCLPAQRLWWIKEVQPLRRVSRADLEKGTSGRGGNEMGCCGAEQKETGFTRDQSHLDKVSGRWICLTLGETVSTS